jgi:nitrogen-specific signal transduction histidine kinase
MSAKCVSKPSAAEQFDGLAAELLGRREAILDAWRAAGDAGPGSIASSLSRAQFNDHIPAVLDCLASTLRSWPDEQDAEAVKLQADRVCEHGLQRWQQGYPLRELIAEWGYLQVCVVDELERYAAEHPSLDPSVMPAARRAWSQLCASGVTQSATQYWRLQQAESAGHVNDLEKALAALHAIEQSRAEAWRTAAHDLRGSVTVVKGAATLLNDRGAQPEVRGEMAEMLNKSVTSLHEMLNDLLSLARLEAGREQRELSTFDAAALLRDFCTASQSAATERGLSLEMDGPRAMPVQGDRTKVLRIVQNLLLNALKYTQRGGVIVTWGSTAPEIPTAGRSPCRTPGQASTKTAPHRSRRSSTAPRKQPTMRATRARTAAATCLRPPPSRRPPKPFRKASSPAKASGCRSSNACASSSMRASNWRRSPVRERRSA